MGGELNMGEQVHTHTKKQQQPGVLFQYKMNAGGFRSNEKFHQK